jgi:hypothetical protein
MSKRTQSLMVLPWEGGLVTSVNEALLSPADLTVADNILLSYSDEKRRREGINYNWDNAHFVVSSRSSTGTSRTINGSFLNTGLKVGDTISLSGSKEFHYNVTQSPITTISTTAITYTATLSFTESSTAETDLYWSNKVVGGIDYWFGSEDAKAQWLVYVLDNGAVYYASGGITHRLNDTGTAWQAPLTEANLEVIENKVLIAVSGPTNVMKYWDGDVSTTLTDLPANLYGVTGTVPNQIFTALASINRSSSGTTRTIKFSGVVATPNGSTIIITGGPAAYKGVFTLLSGTGTDTITYTAGSSLTEALVTDTTMSIGTNAPKALFLRSYAGAMWCNDKTQLDRLYYSGQDIFSWGGNDGLSGATDIGDGDGDPNGITGIAPPFKGTLLVGKRTKLYRIDVPGENFDLLVQNEISKGIGFISHQAIVAIDQDDVLFVSDRGVHSVATSQAYGDFTAAFISKDIQKTFVENFNPGRKRFIKSAYLSEINSAVFAVSYEGSSVNNMLYLFNIQNKRWYRWPNIEAETLISSQDADRRRLYLGTYRGRLAQTQTNGAKDTFFNGEDLYIKNQVVTGLILVDSRPDTIKAFKSIRLVFKSSGSYTITCKVKIDNFSEQAVSFVSNEASLPLGTMVLGSDVLGGSYVTAPHSLMIDGYGRGIRLTFEQNDLNTALALQGFIIEYKGGSTAEEVRYGDEK